MGLSFRKSFRLLPGVSVNLSKHGPSLSVGVPGARATINIKGEVGLYGGAGPLHYRKAIALGKILAAGRQSDGVRALLKILSKKPQS